MIVFIWAAHLLEQLAVAGAGLAGDRVTDIVEVILADHRRIRRLLAAVQEMGRREDAGSRASGLGPLWGRLAELVDLHTLAEQEICYLPLFGRGPGAAARWQDAVADHEDIRYALREAALQPPGSPGWWWAVNAATRLICDHLEAEERGVLAVFAHRASGQLRHYLAQQWASFTAARIRDAAASRPSRPPAPTRLAGAQLTPQLHD